MVGISMGDASLKRYGFSAIRRETVLE